MTDFANRILSPSGKPTDVHGRVLKHNATIEEVYQIVADECTKVHEYYLTQIPPFVARMIQDALVAYGLVVVPEGTDEVKNPVEGCVSPTTEAVPTSAEGAESEEGLLP